MVETIADHGYMHSAKAVMGMVDVDCGPARPPLPQGTDTDREKLRRDLEAMGFFEWINERATTS